MEKKYVLTDHEIEFQDTILYQIVAIRDFGAVKAGEHGGYVESEENLSHEGNCWVRDEAKIFGHAKIKENATISGRATVYGMATVGEDAIVGGEAVVTGRAYVGGCTGIRSQAIVKGNAILVGGTYVGGNALVEEFAYLNTAHASENAKIGGHANLVSYSRVGKDAVILKLSDILLMGPLGSRQSITTFYYTEDRRIMVCCGCFNGTLDEFSEKVASEYKEANDKYYSQYMAAIEFAKKVMN